MLKDLNCIVLVHYLLSVFHFGRWNIKIKGIKIRSQYQHILQITSEEKDIHIDASLLQKNPCLSSSIIQIELVGITSTLREIKKNLVFVQEQDFSKNQTLHRHQGHLSLDIVQLLRSCIEWFIRDLHWQGINLIKIKCAELNFTFLLNCLYYLRRQKVVFPCRLFPFTNLGQILHSDAATKQTFRQILKPMEHQVSQQQQHQESRSCPINFPVLDESVGCLFYRVGLTRSIFLGT